MRSAVVAVDTSDATTGESLGSTTITTLPLATRNFQHRLTLSAGACSDLNSAAALGRGQVYIHVNGGREDNNNYLIEGVSVADYAFGELTFTPLPNPDAIQEFKVSTSLLYSAAPPPCAERSRRHPVRCCQSTLKRRHGSLRPRS